eukprot:TRINITY_DN26086_c0_g1_i1.p1 TRINITY_DN26086_c0_g1~~TRINITY_DN26086_c0_g1_i1.p1  ORF type:complete len:523 (+),score=166.83 TRINITY_DN26086_c0_g1_i1:88-1656(+)
MGSGAAGSGAVVINVGRGSAAPHARPHHHADAQQQPHGQHPAGVPAERRRAERRRERAADLRLASFATVAVLVGMSSLLIWMHFTQGVRGQLDQLGRQGSGEGEFEQRRRLLKERIKTAREQAEQRQHAAWERWAAGDAAAGRVRSRCPPLQEWQQQRRPCPPLDPARRSGSSESGSPTPQPLLLVTDHFNPTQDYLLPHYEELGEWQVSLMQPTLWNIVVRGEAEEQRLRCGEEWLTLTHAFDPMGSLPAAAASASEAAERRFAPSAAEAQHALSGESEVVGGLAALATQPPEALRQAAARRAPRLNGTLFAALSPSGGVKADGNTDRLQDMFAKAMWWLAQDLLQRPVSRWTVGDLEHLHGMVCVGEPAVENVTAIGRLRPEGQHVGFGFDLPPPLGYEVRYLMQLYMGWLQLGTETECAHTALFAFEALVLLHRIQPFQNCNSRVAKLVMNALLMRGGHPPLHMFLHATRDELRRMLNRAYNGERRVLYDFLLQKLLLNGDVLAAGHLRALAPLAPPPA